MKRIVVIITAALVLGVAPVMARSNSVNDAGTFNLQVGVGLGVGTIGYGVWAGYAGYYALPPITVAGNWGINDLFSVGFTAGVYGYGWTDVNYTNIMVGARGNFHFNRWLKVQKLDVYVGLTLGVDIGTVKWYNSSYTVMGFLWNGHAGVKYYFTDVFGLWAEVGYGYSIISGGVVFKF